jgi:hypothetical protein
MSQRRTTLASLHEELRTIEVFDRIYEYATYADPANDCAFAARRVRRKQIMEEIEKLTAQKSEHWAGAIVLSYVRGRFRHAA